MAIRLIILVVSMLSLAPESLYAEISKEMICRTPEFISAKVSPDGKWLARVGADSRGIANVAVRPVGKQSAFEQISAFEAPSITQFFWSADSKKVLLLKDENGTGQLNLHGFDITSKEHLSYTGDLSGVGAKVLGLSSSKNQALVGLNHRNPHFHDLYLLDLDSGDRSLILQNDTYAKFLISDELEVVLKIQISEEGAWTAFLANDEPFLSLSSEEAFQTEFLSYRSASKATYFLDNRSSNTNQLTKKEIVAPYKEEVLGSQEFSDIDEVLFIGGAPKAYASYYTQKQWHALDPALQKDIDFLAQEIGSNSR